MADDPEKTRAVVAARVAREEAAEAPRRARRAKGYARTERRLGRRCEYAHIPIGVIRHGISPIALEDLELGETSMVKHVIELEDPKPFRDRYQKIPPHQYDEVRNHLKEMLEIEKRILMRFMMILLNKKLLSSQADVLNVGFRFVKFIAH